MGSFRGLVRGLPRFDKNAAGGGGGPAYTWTTLDPTWGTSAGNWVLSNGNLTLRYISTGNSAGPGSNSRKTSGKYYFEVHSDLAAPGGFVGALGVGTELHANNYNINTANVCQYTNQADGEYYTNNTYHSSGGITFAAAGIDIGVAVDLDNAKVFVRNAAGWWNSGDPVAGTNPICILGPVTNNGGVSPFLVAGYGSGGNSGYTANFGQNAFVYPVPAGYIPGWPI
jgi:hypothetical protein